MAQNNRLYMTGFGNEFSTEAEPGALPIGCNSPQKLPYGLYAEQLSGSAFTALPHENLRSWLYRIMPSVKHSEFKPIGHGTIRTAPDPEAGITPNQLRWDPLPYPNSDVDFSEGWVTICVNGNVNTNIGSGIHLYIATKSMVNKCFYNSDGDLLIVAQEGRLDIQTEFGYLDIKPGFIAVIPRGIKFSITLPDGKARGYICENYGAPFRLPYRGPIGSNGLANQRDFEYPVASYDQSDSEFEVVTKFSGRLFKCTRPGTPFDVVAWHGNYAPYRYDLSKFNTINTVSFDHPDPSIFTVLTSPSTFPGIANTDFVIFPPRWMVAENTFRPPWYHRNIMSEYMGLIFGVYDAKPGDGGFVPGGGSLHNCMSAHGPDATAFEAGSNEKLTPRKYENTLAFMFESCMTYLPTAYALNSKFLQKDYLNCWKELLPHFSK